MSVGVSRRQVLLAFVGCLILGAAANFIDPWAIERWPELARAVPLLAEVSPWIPASFVFAYALLAWRMGEMAIDRERFADSLYYLGFLLTLVALLASTLSSRPVE